MESFIFYTTVVILVYFFMLGLWYLGCLIYSWPKIIKVFKEVDLGNIPELISSNLIPISITIPTFNGSKRILNTLYSIFNNTYKHVQVIVVNDGSTDNTLEMLINEFDLYEVPHVIKEVIKTSKIHHLYRSKKNIHLWVVDKEHGPANNAADANNVGLNTAIFPLFMTIDDDTVLEPNALDLLVYSFLSQHNTISMGGALRVLNGNRVENGKLMTKQLPSNFIAAVQAVEYLRSFTYGRASMDISSGAAMCFPGAFSLFETHALKEAGGYDVHNPGYDAEITMKLQHMMRKRKYPTNMHFMSAAFAWTEVPNTLKAYFVQRRKWQYGMLRSVFNHISMLFNPNYGFAGLVSFPAFILFEVFGPVVEFISYVLLILAIVLGLLSWKITLLFLLLAWAYNTLITVLSYLLDSFTFYTYKHKNILYFIYLVTLEMFGLRQIRAISCTYGTLKYFLKDILKIDSIQP